jgi:tetratricopeptide (TPR) repeat protein/tRNA A-37 threonylcarbamoyl transferase component Bud32
MPTFVGAPQAEAVTTPSGGEAPIAELARGRTIGRFVLLDRIGRGGMGVVYLAYDPELDRKVALKLVRTPSPADDGRVWREAQALAQLNHPNVVAIHDVGRFEHGVHLAMEYIDGAPLGAWLRAHDPGWRELVAIFIAAGNGLIAAHDAGLVHRDIKPDNLVVGRDGRVRVIDFGLARAAQPDVASDHDAPTRQIDLSLTATGSLLGTPLYMAPEQFGSGVVDARTDVYALCVVMWEALYGARPFDGDTLAGLAETVLAGRITPPPLRRGPAWLQRVLRRGFAVDPAQRFASMRELVAALDRDHLRWTRRGLVAAGFVALGITAVLLRGPQPCEGIDATLEGVWDDERRAALDAAFAASDRVYAGDTGPTVHRLLDEYAAALVAGRRDACIAARVHQTQSDAVLERRSMCLDRRAAHLDALVGLLVGGDAQASEHAVAATVGLPEVATCADIERLAREPALPTDPIARAEVEAIREALGGAETALDAAAFDDLDTTIAAAVARARAVGDLPVLAEALLLRGRWDDRRAGSERAAASLNEALATAITSGHDAIAVDAATRLVSIEGGRDRLDVSDAHAALAHAMLARVGNDPLREVELAHAIGQTEITRGRPERAVEVLATALARAKAEPNAAGSAEHRVMHTLARALMRLDRHDEAAAHLDAVLAWSQAQLGPAHPEVARALLSMAQLRTRQRRPEDALVLVRRARSIYEAAHGRERDEVAAALNDEGRALSQLGRLQEARQAYAEGLAIAERVLGPDHQNVATGLANVAAVDLKSGDASRAVVSLERALAIRRDVFGDDHDLVGKTLDLLGDAHLGVGDLVAADAAYAEAIATFERTGGTNDPRVAYGLFGRGLAAERRGDLATARMHLERALVTEPSDVRDERRGDLRAALARVLPESERARIDALVGEAIAAYRNAPTRTGELAALQAARTGD